MIGRRLLQVVPLRSPASVRVRGMDHMAAGTRKCEQCGTSFVPRREHDRFCSAPCRDAWNRDHAGDLAAGASALVWSVTAMTDATQRLSRVAAADQPRAFTVISEAVWRGTIVDPPPGGAHPAAHTRGG